MRSGKNESTANQHPTVGQQDGNDVRQETQDNHGRLLRLRVVMVRDIRTGACVQNCALTQGQIYPKLGFAKPCARGGNI